MITIPSSQQKAFIQFGESALITGAVAGSVSITQLIAQPGVIDWRQIIIYFLLALGISIAHSLVAAISATQPALSAAIAGLLQALESHSQTLQMNTEAVQAHTAIMTSAMAQTAMVTPPELSSIK